MILWLRLGIGWYLQKPVLCSVRRTKKRGQIHRSKKSGEFAHCCVRKLQFKSDLKIRCCITVCVEMVGFWVCCNNESWRQSNDSAGFQQWEIWKSDEHQECMGQKRELEEYLRGRPDQGLQIIVPRARVFLLCPNNWKYEEKVAQGAVTKSQITSNFCYIYFCWSYIYEFNTAVPIWLNKIR